MVRGVKLCYLCIGCSLSALKQRCSIALHPLLFNQGGPYFHNKFWQKNRYLPILVQSEVEPFLHSTNTPDTEKTKDPLVVAKPISSDADEIPPVVARNVQVTICQNGGGLNR